MLLCYTAHFFLVFYFFFQIKERDNDASALCTSVSQLKSLGIVMNDSEEESICGNSVSMFILSKSFEINNSFHRNSF